MYNKQQILTI